MHKRLDFHTYLTKKQATDVPAGNFSADINRVENKGDSCPAVLELNSNFRRKWKSRAFTQWLGRFPQKTHWELKLVCIGREILVAGSEEVLPG